MSYIRNFFRAETENVVTKLLKISSEAKKVIISSRDETMLFYCRSRRGGLADVCFAPSIQTRRGLSWLYRRSCSIVSDHGKLLEVNVEKQEVISRFYSNVADVIDEAVVALIVLSLFSQTKVTQISASCIRWR